MQVWRKRMGLLLAGALGAAGCSSESTPSGSGCSDVSGDWKFTTTKTGGTCPPGVGDGQSATITMQRRDAGADWTLIFPGIPGGCPGVLDADTCRFTAKCTVAGKPGADAVVVDVDWTFADATFKGTARAAFAPPVAPSACQAGYVDEGTR